ncbi:MAG: hypothetical protein EP333_08380 [Bacteroidetes bacterium]|nr:MAG: hypothetical protein EP333_08380 [Bacteroidota bacterium]
MKKFFLPLITLVIVSACGSDAPEVEIVNLETFEDRLSYALGAMNGNALMEEPNANQLDKEALVQGFSDNYSDQSVEDCDGVMLKLYGPYGMDFDTTYRKEGSICKGRQLGHFFYKGMSEFDKLGKIRKDKLVKGFEHALDKADTLMTFQEQQTIIAEFYKAILKESADNMFAKARKIPNIKEIEGGILIETIEEGKGGSPTEQDDVKADYILMASTGDTIQNSLLFRQDPTDLSQAPAFNLQQVFMGWTKSFPNLKKGGKYRLYLPWEMVNDPRLQDQSVCFYVHFIDYGPAYSIAEKPQMP